MNIYPLLFAAASLLAQEVPKSPLPPVAAAAAIEGQTKSIMMIDPKGRMSDYIQAFDLLRKDKPTQRVQIRTTDLLLSGVIDLSPSAAGTLIIIKVQSSQGSKIHIVPVEQILEISHTL